MVLGTQNPNIWVLGPFPVSWKIFGADAVIFRYIGAPDSIPKYDDLPYWDIQKRSRNFGKPTCYTRDFSDSRECADRWVGSGAENMSSWPVYSRRNGGSILAS